ncbi:MAG: hypothetical protein FWG21_01765 [Oscillospiraceae bacterium]|nr:hypothetical protein [Oscillospiraceae bacterium]
MSTAVDPSLLMKVGDGVTSAVLGPSGKIVSQAPFIQVASSMSTVAPIMAMQAISTIMMLQQFSIMDKKLDEIKGTIDTILARHEATEIAELFSAGSIIDELYLQYDETGNFSNDMLIRLALAERDAMVLSRRYELLDNIGEGDATSLNLDSYDTYCAMLASFLNLRVKYLRTSVDLQENPQFIATSSETFNRVLKESINSWDNQLSKSTRIKKDIDELSAQVENANLIQRITQTSVKELSRRKDEYTAVMEKERVIIDDFHTLITTAKEIATSDNTKAIPNLIYWSDSDGEHCIATNENLLLAV